MSQPQVVGDWRRTPDGRWLHAPWWKVLVNNFLRRRQPRQRRKWVIYTRSTVCGDPPEVLGYGFGRILHLPDTDGDG